MDGIINVYKEAGYTSFDVVAKLRGVLETRKLGHTGTLDPDAVGVLPVCIGMGTKVCELLMDETKEYVALMRLGVVTDTLDMSGEIISEDYAGAKNIPSSEVREAIMSFVGEITQIPPMYSAVKVNGQKLCDLARKGQEIDRTPRQVRIDEIEILDGPIVVGKSDCDDAEKNGGKDDNGSSYVNYKIRVVCSKGTYIRTLINDIGQKLGCGAAMEQLERTRVGRFKAEDALTIEEISRKKEEGCLHNYIVPVDIMFEQHAPLHVTEQGMKALNNGNQIQENDIREVVEGVKLKKRMVYRMYSYDNQFRALYEYHSGWKVLKPVKIFSIG